MENDKVIYDVITFTFHEEDQIPMSATSFGDIHSFIYLINESKMQDMIALSDTQEGVSIYVRNTIGLNDFIFIMETEEWIANDPAGQFSQFKTMVLEKLIPKVDELQDLSIPVTNIE